MGRHFKEEEVTHQSGIKTFFQYIFIILAVLILSIFIRTFVVSPYVIPSSSMEPTIAIGDHIFAEKISIRMEDSIERGDIVTFKSLEDEDITLIKRVIGLPGETVDIQDGHVLINGKVLDEPYVHGATTYELETSMQGEPLKYPYTIPNNAIWVMGDNRENSADSRYFGAVPLDNITGNTLVRYWPISRVGSVD